MIKIIVKEIKYKIVQNNIIGKNSTFIVISFVKESHIRRKIFGLRIRDANRFSIQTSDNADKLWTPDHYID